MEYPKPVKRSTIIKAIATVLSIVIVMIFAPRMEEPRIIGGIKFTSKSGGDGLTGFGWVLLIFVPLFTYLITGLVLKRSNRKNG